MEDNLSLLSITLVLFVIMDPVGNIGSYLTLMRDVVPKRKNWVLLREMGFAFLAMLLFNYIGEYIFSILNISEVTVRLASGLILFLTAIKILFPSMNGLRSNLPRGEPFIIPLAIPLTAGPSLLATVMLYAHLEPSEPLMLISIVLACVLTLLVFWLASPLHRILGNNGLLALEKLMGMILVLMAVQRFAEGIQQFHSVAA